MYYFQGVTDSASECLIVTMQQTGQRAQVRSPYLCLNMNVRVCMRLCVWAHGFVVPRSLPSGGFNRVEYSFAFYMTLGQATLACLLCSDQMLKWEHRVDCKPRYIARQIFVWASMIYCISSVFVNNGSAFMFIM